MAELVTLPSGLSGTLSGLKGKSMRLLGDKQVLRSGLLVDKILNQCWLDTSDPGPYELVEGKPDWSKVLMGDRQHALIQVRAKTFGPEFAFKLNCPNRSCRARFDHSVDLNELSLRYLKEEDKEAFRNGNRLTGTLPDGRSFAFRLLVGADETKLSKNSGQIDPLNVLKSRIYEIDGIDPKSREMNLYFEDADFAVILKAKEEMEEHDCGVETGISLECPECTEAIDIEIPFEQGFLAPTKTA